MKKSKSETQCSGCKKEDDSNNLCALMEFGKIYYMHRECAIKKFKTDADVYVKDVDYINGVF